MAQINMQMLNQLKKRIEAERLLRSKPKVRNVPSIALRKEDKRAA
jgi:hypothetical protein